MLIKTLPTALVLIFVVFFGPSFPVTAQNQKVVDSLHHVLMKKTGGDRFPVLYELAFQHLDRDNEKALMFITKAEVAALQSGDSLWIVKSKRVKGQILYRLERLDEAIEALEESLDLASRSHMHQELQMIDDAIGIVYMVSNRFDKALHFYLAGLEIARQRKDAKYIYQYLNKIGITYYKLADYKKALDFYFQSLKVGKTTPYTELLGYINVSLCYINLDKFIDAKRFLDAVSRECEAGCPDKVLLHMTFADGLLYYMLNDLENAEASFINSLQYAKQVNNRRMVFDNIYLLSGIYLKTGALSTAEQYLNEALSLLNETTPFPQNRLDLYKRFSELYRRHAKFREASMYQSKYIELRDSLYSQENTVRLMAKEVEFAQHRNAAKIEAQAEALKLNQEIVQRQKVVNLLTGALGLIVTVLLVSLFSNYRRKKAANALLEEQVRRRTFELEKNRTRLTTTLARHRLVANRAVTVLIAKFNTIKGLCSTGRMEIGDRQADQYFNKIDETSREMETYLKAAFEGTGDYAFDSPQTD